MSENGIPIFIISFNRLEALKQSIASYERFFPKPRIIIHDASSTFQPLLDYLDEQERGGVTVYRDKPSIKSQDGLNKLAETVAHYFTTHDPSYYVVTDPDIAFGEDAPPDTLDFFQALLETIPDIDVAGPMLRIDDLPDHYPLKDAVIQRHTKQFYDKKRRAATVKGQKITYVRGFIDTTFGMYRPGFPFRKMCAGARILGPYWAQHLDWYLNPNEMTADQEEYLKTASNVSHWGGKWLREVASGDKTAKDYFKE